ncbi:hypothetical protein B0J14DRAFT_650816 [Halenospora varia]|nr:hypothetical protein B0J14DRAFT_650816 [Halenospora varia]
MSSTLDAPTLPLPRRLTPLHIDTNGPWTNSLRDLDDFHDIPLNQHFPHSFQGLAALTMASSLTPNLSSSPTRSNISISGVSTTSSKLHALFNSSTVTYLKQKTDRMSHRYSIQAMKNTVAARKNAKAVEALRTADARLAKERERDELKRVQASIHFLPPSPSTTNRLLHHCKSFRTISEAIQKHPGLSLSLLLLQLGLLSLVASLTTIFRPTAGQKPVKPGSGLLFWTVLSIATMLIGFASSLLFLLSLLAKCSNHCHDEEGFELQDLERGDRVFPATGYEEGGYVSILSDPTPPRPQPVIVARAERRRGVFGHDRFSGHHLKRISMLGERGEMGESQRDLLEDAEEMGAGPWVRGSDGSRFREELDE